MGRSCCYERDTRNGERIRAVGRIEGKEGGVLPLRSGKRQAPCYFPRKL